MSAKKVSGKKKKDSLTTGQSLAEYFVNGIMLVFVFFMLCLYPLLYHNKYFDMGAAKYAIFKWACIIGLGLMTIAWGFWLYFFREKLKPQGEIRSFSKTDWFALAFLLLSALSFAFSSDRETALWGYEGWFMGVMSQLFFVLIYFYVSRFWKVNRETLFAMIGAAVICYQIGILQRFSFNPLGMYDGVQEADVEKFLSTLGQTSWYSSYAIMIVPFGMYFYWTAREKKARILSGMFTALSFGMICTTNSDSAYVALLLILMAFFCYSLQSNEKLGRFLEMVLIGLLSFRVIGIMYALFPERQRTYITGDEKITKFLTNSAWMLLLTLVVAAIYALLLYLSKKKKAEGKEAFDISKYRTLIWRITLAAAVLVIWGAVMLIILVTQKKLPAFMSSLYEVSFLNFDMAWGNHRGFNWRAAVAAFTHANLKDLLIGVGPDCFATAMNKYYAAEVADYWHGLQLACAHNEWLNMLVTQGFLGLAAYVGIFVSSLWRASRYVKDEPVLLALMGAVLAYMGHNIFCYQQCICTPIVFIFIAIIECKLRKLGSKTE